MATCEDASAGGVGLRGAQVRARTLPVVKGAILQVQEIDGGFKTRAGVLNISIGPDGQPRLNLLFLDSSAPERMLPGVTDRDIGQARVQPHPPSAAHEKIRQLIGENRQLVRGG